MTIFQQGTSQMTPAQKSIIGLARQVGSYVRKRGKARATAKRKAASVQTRIIRKARKRRAAATARKIGTKLVKGSQSAKNRMAKLRAMRKK